jgi:gliding motility-associated-like protein
VFDDNIVEGAETVIITLNSTSNGSVTIGTPSSATVTIADGGDTSTVSIVATVPDATESNLTNPAVNGEFTITLSNPVSVAITVNYTVSGTATPGASSGNGNDYEALSGSVVIPAGSTSVTLSVVVFDDNIDEDNETVVVTLITTNNSSVIIGSPSTATVTIIDQEVGGVAACLTIYNEFTPNGDGINDYFKIECVELYPNNQLEVYNRWGHKVYEKQRYNNNWDGTANTGNVVNRSDKLPVGTYYYVFNLGDGTKALSGWLYIQR